MNHKTSFKPKVILLWNDLGPWKDYQYGIGKFEPFVKRNCPVTNCEITKNKSHLSESDLVIVHMRSKFSYLPTNRPEKTRMVFFIIESPIHSYQFHPKYNGLFNLTATYNLNSDFSPYYYSNIEFKWERNLKFDENQDFSINKTKLAFFLATNCRAFSKRTEYVKEMQKHSNRIDVYGGCGKSCNISGEDRFSSNLCRQKLSKDYRFLLAFENSMCKDYITEKLLDTVLFDIVPVVFGYGPYDQLIPRSAYINALDFKTPKELVNYLTYLESNSTAYNSYFKWKKYIKKTNTKYNTLCDMCIKLNLENFYGVKKSIVNDLETFWGVKKNCWAAPNLFQKRTKN
ncbi:alpha-(1-3)-fucosyltransferase C-like [Brachionus plicatilis]|uniref:Fucosyltransferase n=1 Tax=Brachionus plicatilis TaxID=10195 RepID=A0A3M7Q1L8_BRAPC|nr:alpha-(1-3)-fucosyltransferase C-like [Brachionus plicatilis]